MSITTKLALVFALVAPAFAQGHRFPPIDLYNGDPTGNVCTGNLIQQSGTTGKMYTCQSGHMAQTSGSIANGTATMTTSAITAPACGATVSIVATGVLTTDAIVWSFNAAPDGSNAGIVSWPTAGHVNFAYCPGVTETPSAATLNWRVER